MIEVSKVTAAILLTDSNVNIIAIEELRNGGVAWRHLRRESEKYAEILFKLPIGRISFFVEGPEIVLCESCGRPEYRDEIKMENANPLCRACRDVTGGRFVPSWKSYKEQQRFNTLNDMIIAQLKAKKSKIMKDAMKEFGVDIDDMLQGCNVNTLANSEED